MKARTILRGIPGWLMLVREDPSEYERTVLRARPCQTSASVHELLRGRLAALPNEVLVVVLLNGRNQVTGMVEVARGGIHGCAVSARDVLRVVVASGASKFVLAHNHPSGDPTPSKEDIVITRAVARAAAIVGTPLVDHVIVGSWERYSSLLDLGILGGEEMREAA
jgi:DNA repair protein RadC